jgi:aminopeptidase N
MKPASQLVVRRQAREATLPLAVLRLALILPLLLAGIGCATRASPAPQPVSTQRPKPAPAASLPAEAARPAPAAATPAATRPVERDPHSFSHPDEVAVEHLRLALTVDFAARQLVGRASLRLANPQGATRLWLDTRDLDVRKVTLDDGEREAPFTLGDEVRFLGRPLAIEITAATRWVHIDYATRPEAAALQWLDPAQAGSRSPFLYTQSEAILARTWVPCQDTPGVRMTYEATIRVPPGLLALMSAENPTGKSADGLYRFRMPQRIPSYLLALAVGDLEYRPLGPISGVYALPGVVERAAWELADTPRMIAAAERLGGPYPWGRYDLLILPASYPFGGMENPRLTFATPTVLAGNRSLVSLVAHELAHSWSGNLVTNATWNDFWLNEGTATYFEGRIMEAVYGRPYFEMQAVLDRQDLDAALRELGPDSPDTRLHLDLAGRDPDEGGGDVAYQKGALFLRTLEEAVGRPAFDRFLHGYFERFAFQSIDSASFVRYLQQQLFAAHPELAARVPVDAWIYGPGVPPGAVQPRSPAFAPVDQAIAAFVSGAPAARLTTAGWNTQQWLHFLRGLPPLASAQMADLDAAFHFSASGNSEVLCVWLQSAIAAHYEAATPVLERFLMAVGRRKLVQPLYTALAKTPQGAEVALRIYERARPGYHAITRQTIDGILGWRG